MRFRGQRWSDEDGRYASARNFGRLGLALVPAALALGALWWIAAAQGWLDFARTRRVEQRAMNAVGLVAPPTAPITLLAHSAACMRVDSSFMDGQTFVFYATNTCRHWLSQPDFLYRVKASDGTVIESERYIYDGDYSLAPDEKREQRVGLKRSDDRAATIELWVTDGR